MVHLLAVKKREKIFLGQEEGGKDLLGSGRGEDLLQGLEERIRRKCKFVLGLLHIAVWILDSVSLTRGLTGKNRFNRKI